MHLVERGTRSRCGRDRVARVLGRLVFIAEEQRTPRFSQVPDHLVRQHAQEDVGLDAILEPVSAGSDFESDGLQ